MTATENCHPDFTIYATGVCMSSVCSSLPQAEVEARMRSNPTGIASPWTLSDEAFRDGTPNPGPCNTNPETHTHYLFSC
jgi:hypothetical protein